MISSSLIARLISLLACPVLTYFIPLSVTAALLFAVSIN